MRRTKKKFWVFLQESIEKKIYNGNHGWTQKRANKSDEASIFLTKVLGTATRKIYGKGCNCFVCLTRRLKLIDYAFFFANNFFSANLNLNAKSKDEIKHTFNIREFLKGMVDLLHVTRIKGDKIMKMFSCLNSVLPAETM